MKQRDLAVLVALAASVVFLLALFNQEWVIDGGAAGGLLLAEDSLVGSHWAGTDSYRLLGAVTFGLGVVAALALSAVAFRAKTARPRSRLRTFGISAVTLSVGTFVAGLVCLLSTHDDWRLGVGYPLFVMACVLGVVAGGLVWEEKRIEGADDDVPVL